MDLADSRKHNRIISGTIESLRRNCLVDKMMAGGQQDALDAMIQTVPVRRLGRPEEIANAVLWLCSEMASLVVGHTLVVDGGYSIQ
jgi:NAD(P)-dependent dehydrogenase (short-subunit alcohol dehydrogenase family)